MKKLTAILLSTVMVLSLAACGSQDSGKSGSDTLPSGTAGTGNESQESVGQQEDEDTGASIADSTADMAADSSEDVEAEEEDSPAEVSEEAAADEAGSESQTGEGRTLVVYYSATGHTGNVAGYIAAATDGDVFELVPAEAYSSEDLNWSDENSRVVYEHDHPDEREVELVEATVADWDSYDTVFIGFPIWWGIAAWPVDSFIAANDFTGKTVVPFCTSSSSGLGESGRLLAEAAGTGEWLEGMRFSSGASEDTVKEWVESLNLQ